MCFCRLSFNRAAVPLSLVVRPGLTTSTCGFYPSGRLGATLRHHRLRRTADQRFYTMLGTAMYDAWYQQTHCAGDRCAVQLATLAGHLHSPSGHCKNLRALLRQLANYLDAKANLFDPDAERDADLPWMDVAMANSALVALLNQTKASLLTRLKGDRGQRGTRRTLHYYFVAQDIHERASSSHVQYHALSRQFRHSDILFRFQRLLSMQARACRQLAQSILLRQKYQHNPRFEPAFSRIQEALARIAETQGNSEQTKALAHLLKNLHAIDAQLANIESEQTLASGQAEENSLADDRLTGWSDIRLRISRHLTPQSALFRHAIRMSVVLCVGYAFIQFTGMQHGYWILLTSLFVCQPNYNATRRRLALRIIGTWPVS
ncbi:FUSC family protein [Serratia ureilytica]